MPFNAFQSATATMKKIDKDGYGDETETASFSVDIDPVFGWKRGYNTDGEQVTGKTTIISAHDSIDVAHTNWKLEYNGKEYIIKDMVPFYSIGGNVLEHVEVMLL